MVIYKTFNNDKLTQLVRDGGIGALPTDTVYGLVCSAFDKEAVETIYEIKGRDDDKPMIILISSWKELSNFGVKLSNIQRDFVTKYWPGMVSVILPVVNGKYDYLTRNKATLAFRVPDDNKLLSFLQKTGPLVAPSANPQDRAVAKDVDEIMDYFIGRIDFVVDGGSLEGSASTLVDLSGELPKVLRQGDAKIK